MRERELGACRLYVANDGGSWLLRREQYESVRAAWMKGEAFWTGEDFYGCLVTIKLSTIVGIGLSTVESIAARAAAIAADKAEDVLTGGG